jgi:hypothetical protein
MSLSDQEAEQEADREIVPVGNCGLPGEDGPVWKNGVL